MLPIVVIGGGITGSLTAYFLARAGQPVILIEQSGIGSQASGKNPGGINPLHGPGIPGPMSAFALHSYQLHLHNQTAIMALSGLDFQFQQVSRIEVALTENEVVDLHKSFDLYNATDGFSARWLGREALAAAEPRVSAEAVAGLLLEGNIMVDSFAYTRAAAEAARTLGAQLVRGAVRGLRYTNGQVREVLVGDESLSCAAVVVANGAWAVEAGAWLGSPIPVIPIKGELLLVEWPGSSLPHHVTRQTMGVYSLPNGRALLGGTREAAGFDVAPTRRGYEDIIKGVARFMPDARKAKLLRHMAALRPMTQDGLPLLGRIPGYGNAYVATGGGSKGILLATGMAEAITNLIAGKEPTLSITAFCPDRKQ